MVPSFHSLRQAAGWAWLVRNLFLTSTAHLAGLLAVLLSSGGVHADTAHFRRLSVQDGLSASSVESIAEDRFGFIWFGTQEGLNRFDGYRFSVYQASQEAGYLNDGFIRAIVPDPDGDLWVGTSSGLQHLDVATLRFSDSVTPPGVGVILNTLRVAPDGRLWFAGSDGGLWTRSATRQDIATLVATEIIAPSMRVTAIARHASGDLLVAADGRCFRFTVTSASGEPEMALKSVTAEVGRVSAMHVEEDMVWLGRYDAEPLRIDLRSGERTEYPRLPAYALTIAPAGKGRIWIGGKGAGVTRFDPSTMETLIYRHEPGNEDSLAEDDVAVIHQDRGGSLWVGAWNGGLSRLDLHSQAFRTLRYTPGQPRSLPDNDVRRMAEGPDGRLWAVTRNDVLTVGDPVRGSFVTHPFEGDLTTIAFTGSDLYVGTSSGLVRIDPLSERLVPIGTEIRQEGLDRMSIDELAGSRDHLWALSEGAVYRIDSDRIVQRVSLPEHCGPVSIYPSSTDVLWIACEEGTILRAEVEGGALAIRAVGDGRFTERGRLSFITENEGTIWVGAARGIGRLDRRDGNLEWIHIDRALPSRSVTSIIPDDAGRLWIATERGITRFDPHTGEAVRFGEVQGAQGSGYVEGGSARGASGRIYFAGRGITVFDPQRVTDNPHPPRVVFSSLEILHRSVRPAWMEPDSPLPIALHAAEELTLGPDAAVFSVEMAAPGASDPQGLRFAHRLEGFDEHWIETGAERRVATYSRLAPGEYVLRARARSPSGKWSREEASLRIRILPPWWRTPAAISLWILLAALAIVALVHEARRRTRVRIALAEQEMLRRTSVTDPLTGLYNRRFLAEWLKREIPRIQRTYHPQSTKTRESLLVVAADLDNLKEINDRFGHDSGDQAIRAVADILSSHARADDLAVRLGGDEFLLILRSVDHEQATHVVERLRTSVGALEVSSDDAVRPTISLGFAFFPFAENDPAALSWEQIVQLADRALLHSKRRGRNVWSGFVESQKMRPDAVSAFLREGTARSPERVLCVIEGPLEAVNAGEETVLNR